VHGRPVRGEEGRVEVISEVVVVVIVVSRVGE
jgi:hypothetical protein